MTGNNVLASMLQRLLRGCSAQAFPHPEAHEVEPRGEGENGQVSARQGGVMRCRCPGRALWGGAVNWAGRCEECTCACRG